MTDSENQRHHYESILQTYDAHYFDTSSQRYRDEFIYKRLWQDLDLNGKRVADLACGSGYNSEALLRRYPSAVLTGFDIAPTACASYKKKTGFDAYECDLTKDGTFFDEEFDAAIVIGGIHHCVANLSQTFQNIATMLVPGGLLLMMEPNSDYMLEAIRKFWYRHDPSFDAPNEHALNHDKILELAKDHFTAIDRVYFGGPAFFIILNSMILRVPLGVKPYIALPLTWIERAWNSIPGSRFHNAFLARWQKRTMRQVGHASRTNNHA